MLSTTILKRTLNTMANTATRQNTVLAAAVDAAAAHSQQHIDLANVNLREAAKLMSEEHKILGYRPPHDSLAAQAQAAAAKHPDAPGAVNNVAELKRLAADDAARVEAERGNPVPAGAAYREIDLNGGLTGIGQAEASKLMSAEHKALGYRPPADSLAAKAQRAAAGHPDTKPTIDPTVLADAAIKDAARIAAERGASGEINLADVTEEEARKLQSLEQKALAGESTAGTLAAAAQSVVDQRQSASQ
ncbi:hypothetical protein EXIGLDRAFT_724934 [Exidia glandulosa HHB12029]|uniref:SMP domain-containing protein n=1 Tax=Exidia glandulosa HHB12029 TaxID=1314781 RepID=A0A165MLN4_EXIGL|nr:hypothetical protein EXIGLDRAFT_724934 [Exidia glandulosa HHB12029]